MITIIDNNKQKAYNCTNKSKASEVIGVCSKTIMRWSRKTLKETYNQFDIYFDSVLLTRSK
jgi:hypothetical protein